MNIIFPIYLYNNTSSTIRIAQINKDIYPYTYFSIKNEKELSDIYFASKNFEAEIISGDLILTKDNLLAIPTNVFTSLEAIHVFSLHEFTDEINKKIVNESSNGVRAGFTISINADPTKFNISSGYANQVNTTDPINPTGSVINFPGITGVSVTNILTHNVTYLAMDFVTNAIIQETSPFTIEDRRDHVLLGVIIHSNRTTINAVNNLPDVAGNSISQFNDLLDSMRNFNVSGNIISPNGINLSINKSIGYVFKKGVNFFISHKNPHKITLSGLIAPTNIRYRLNTGTEYADTAVLDPGYYDLNGVRTVLNPNKFTIQRIVIFTSNLIRIQYGQAFYGSMSEAIQAINSEVFITEQNIAENGLLRCILIIKSTATDLSDLTQAKFFEVDKWGGSNATASGSGTTTIQQAYNNSTQPQITTTAALSALQIKRGSTADTDKVFEILSGSNISTFNIKGNGDVNITGNIYQVGTSYTTHAEQIFTTKDIIITRDGAVSGLGTGVYTGFQAKLYDGINDGFLVLDNGGWARIGDAGSLVKIATIEETPDDATVAYYDSASFQLKTLDGITTTKLGYLTDVTSNIQAQLNTKDAILTFGSGLTRTVNAIANNLITGLSGGQTVIGGTASGNNLTLFSTSHATKGKILFGASTYDEVNDTLGIGITTPLYPIHIYRAAAESGIRTSWGTTDVYLSHGGWTLGAGKFGIGGATAPSIMIDTATNNISVGTITTTTYKLNVVGNIALIDKLYIAPTNLSAINTSGSIINAYHNSTNGTYIFGGILADTYRDVADPSYTAGMWFESITSGGVHSSTNIIFGGMLDASATTRPTEMMKLIGLTGNILVGGAITNGLGRLQIKGPDTQKIVFGNTDWDVSTIGSGSILYNGATSGDTYSAWQAYKTGGAYGNIILNSAGGNVLNGRIDNPTWFAAGVNTSGIAIKGTATGGETAAINIESKTNITALELATTGVASVNYSNYVLYKGGGISFYDSTAATSRMALSTDGNLILPTLTGNKYILTEEIGAGTGRLSIQAGSGSAAMGGAIHFHAHAHASRPGQVIVGLSSGATGAKFAVNDSGLAGGTDVFNVMADGRIYGSNLHNNVGDVTGVTNQYITSGTYTPTLYNTTNVDASASLGAQWFRIGNLVTVSGEFNLDITSASTTTAMGLSLPIPSNFSQVYQLAGSCVASSEIASMEIIGDVANDRATVTTDVTTNVANTRWSFHFTYVIL